MSLFDDASLVTTPNGYKASKLYSIKPTSGLGDMTVVRATTARRVNSAGLIESVANNVPRLDYPPLGGCPSILIEPLRTNLVLRSEEFDNASWGKLSSATVTADTITSPDGTSTADTINLSTTADTRVVQNCLIANSTTYTLSCFFKNIALTAGQTFVLRYNNQLGSPNNFQMIATIDLAAGAASYSLAGTSVTGYSGVISGAVETYANGWYRISVTLKTGTAAANSGQIQIIQPTASQARSFYAWGAQMEVGSNATSYIPTTTATVTRNADVINKTGVSSLIGQTEGTIYAEILIKQITNDYLICALSLTGLSVTNAVVLTVNAAGRLVAQLYAAGVMVVNTINTPFVVGNSYKVAFGYKSGSSVVFVNGTQVGTTDTDVFVLTTLNAVSLSNTGYYVTGGQQAVKSTVLFPTRLTNAQLATLTTP
jgi:hypothetical protein